jgi:hypothetical protein
VNSWSSTLTSRLTRLVFPYRNALARGSDKLESASLAFVVLVGLSLGPVMLVFGSIVHADVVAAGERQARTRHAVVAVLTQDAPDTETGEQGSTYSGKPMVPATWTKPDGTTGKGEVEAAYGLQVGAKVEIWLDEHGREVDRPVTEADAAADGVLVALVGWVTVLVLLTGAQAGVHLLLNRRRYRAWDRQWEQIEPGWNNYRR